MSAHSSVPASDRWTIVLRLAAPSADQVRRTRSERASVVASGIATGVSVLRLSDPSSLEYWPAPTSPPYITIRWSAASYTATWPAREAGTGVLETSTLHDGSPARLSAQTSPRRRRSASKPP